MSASRYLRWRRPLAVLLGLVLVVALLAWLMGGFHARIPPAEPAPVLHAAPDAARHTVQSLKVARHESAVGTVRAVHETAVAARILGRIRTLRVDRAGQPVTQGEVLVELEAADLQAVVEQGRASLAAAETRRDKARIDLQRTEELVRGGVAPEDRLDADRAAFRAAEAEVERARQAVAGAESAVGFATIRAPITGIVVDKKVNLGDIAQPGQVLFSLYDPTRLQLVAVVREELAGSLRVGDPVRVTLDALGKECAGTVAEIVPEAQARTRSFEVKVVGPCQPGIVTGMFGRLHIPVGEREEVRVPKAALASVGQLDFAYVVGADGGVRRRYVRLGPVEAATGTVEVLSGLAPGEVVVAEAAAVRAR
ncbi:MAG: efflux RND transporter periplasmic adaptor subunit [Planctomycetes bacterium]|nr:efflux RND transporter periplasmic adaptor subunit [Planctomycetota bacterium]